MNPKHTPGPWEARKNEWCEWNVHVPARESRGLLYIIARDVGGDSSGSMYGTPEDNARLIAAAPELLDAAAAIDDNAEECEGPDGAAYMIDADLLHALRDAIAKATGDES